MAVVRGSRLRSSVRHRIALAVGIGWGLAWLAAADVVLPALGRLPASCPLWQIASAERLGFDAPGTFPGAAIAAARPYARWAAVGGIAFAGLAWLLTRRRFARELVPRASPAALGMVRAWSCGIAIAITLLERAPTTAALPRDMLRSMGLFDVVRAVPGVAQLLQSENALQGLEYAGLLVLALAAAGLWTRWTMALAAGFFLFEQGLLRAYSRFFHTGLVLCYVLVVLAMSSCSDGFSLDRWRARRNAPAPSVRYGGALWCCWLAVTLPYLEAGLMKLRRGGVAWFHADNLRAIVLTDSLGLLARAKAPPHFILSLPDWFVSALAIAAVALEILFPLALVSRPCRLMLPLLMGGFHLSTWLLQGVFFLDLFLLQVIFLLPWMGRRREPVPGSARRPVGGGGALRSMDQWRRASLAMGAVFWLTWALRAEAFPFSAMQMYAKADISGSVRYLTLLGRYSSGGTEPVSLEACVPALRDARHRWALDALFREATAAPGTRLIEMCLERLPKKAGGERLASMLVERWRWDFAQQGSQPVRVGSKEVARARQTAKLEPQPQLPTAFGFENLKPAPCIPST